MGNRRKPGIVSGAGSLLASIWGAYSHATTLADLPNDAGEIAKMMADPPAYMPWLILAGSVIVLAWSLWPSKPGDTPDPLEKSSGDTFTQNHSGSGDNIGKNVK
jgi:hypothetical protein